MVAMREGGEGVERGRGWRTAATHRQLSDGNCCCARGRAPTGLREYERSYYRSRLRLAILGEGPTARSDPACGWKPLSLRRFFASFYPFMLNLNRLIRINRALSDSYELYTWLYDSPPSKFSYIFSVSHFDKRLMPA